MNHISHIAILKIILGSIPLLLLLCISLGWINFDWAWIITMFITWFLLIPSILLLISGLQNIYSKMKGLSGPLPERKSVFHFIWILSAWISVFLCSSGLFLCTISIVNGIYLIPRMQEAIIGWYSILHIMIFSNLQLKSWRKILSTIPIFVLLYLGKHRKIYFKREIRENLSFFLDLLTQEYQ